MEINHWLLPDGVQDLLPDDTAKLEVIRRSFLNQLRLCGYEQLMPAWVEYTESLLGHASEDVKRQTFKIIDQTNGRLMGVRADITQQIARIDASADQRAVSRYCYADSVLHTLPTDVFGSRTPFQMGAEIYGHQGLSADIELIDLMLGQLTKILPVHELHLNLGHVGIAEALFDLAGLERADRVWLLKCYERKALPELKSRCESLPMGSDFELLGRSSAELDVLMSGLSAKAQTDQGLTRAIMDLQRLLNHLSRRYPDLGLSVDAAHVSSYHYHTGLVFSAYGPGASPIVRGGRYDNLSKHFGRSRFATGFSLDALKLLGFMKPRDKPIKIAAPVLDDAKLDTAIKDERDQGNIVVLQLGQVPTAGVTHFFKLTKGEWAIMPLTPES